MNASQQQRVLLRILLSAVVVAAMCVNGFGSSSKRDIVFHRKAIPTSSSSSSSSSRCGNSGVVLSMQHPQLQSQPKPIDYNKELFSVAPMMAHTNRHYRYYWRLFSSRTFLYTEMIPAQQIVALYDKELKKLEPLHGVTNNGRNSLGLSIDTDEILEVVYQIQQPSYNGKRISSTGTIDSLDELLRISTQQQHQQ